MQFDHGHFRMCDKEFESPFDVIQCCMDNPDIFEQKDGNIIKLKQPVVNARKPTRYVINNYISSYVKLGKIQCFSYLKQKPYYH